MRSSVSEGRKRGWLLVPLFVLRDVGRALRARFRRSLRNQRVRVISLLAEPGEPPPAPERALVVITHVVPESDTRDAARLQWRADRLVAAIDGLVSSFDAFRTDIVLNTYRGLDAIALLPPAHASLCEVITHETGDPMHVEFAAGEIFAERKEAYDWFVFLEDDIAIQDACFLSKIAEFNRLSPHSNALLLPHRYELLEARKYYVDRDFDHRSWGGGRTAVAADRVNRLTSFAFESPLLGRSVTFAEFTNPHAACYCLDRRQLDRWIASGRIGIRDPSWIGPLESAATGVLMDCFDLFKPHPRDRGYLEVRHVDTRFAKRIRAGDEDGA